MFKGHSLCGLCVRTGYIEAAGECRAEMRLPPLPLVRQQENAGWGRRLALAQFKQWGEHRAKMSSSSSALVRQQERAGPGQAYHL